MPPRPFRGRLGFAASARLPGERLTWRLAAAWILAIYASAYLAQFALDALRRWDVLRAAVLTIVLLAATMVGVALLRARPGPRELALMLASVALYVVVLSRMMVVQERLHILEYGLVGGLFYRALRLRWWGQAQPPPCWRVMAAPAAGALCGASSPGWPDGETS